jgi:hypothetical protein
MQIKHLVYCGKRKKGNLRVARLDVLDHFRNIEYYEGMRLEVGKVVPLNTAEIIAKDYPNVFKMETKELDDGEAFFYQIHDIISEAIINLGESETLKLIEKLIVKEFGEYSIKKKVKPKPKPKRRRN